MLLLRWTQSSLSLRAQQDGRFQAARVDRRSGGADGSPPFPPEPGPPLPPAPGKAASPCGVCVRVCVRAGCVCVCVCGVCGAQVRPGRCTEARSSEQAEAAGRRGVDLRLPKSREPGLHNPALGLLHAPNFRAETPLPHGLFLLPRLLRPPRPGRPPPGWAHPVTQQRESPVLGALSAEDVVRRGAGREGTCCSPFAASHLWGAGCAAGWAGPALGAQGSGSAQAEELRARAAAGEADVVGDEKHSNGKRRRRRERARNRSCSERRGEVT